MPLELLIVQKPYEINFSGNPITYSFAFTPYGVNEMAQEIKIQCKIFNEVVPHSGIWKEIHSKIFFPTPQGTAIIDIASFADSYLYHYTPKANLNRAIKAAEQYGRFKISIVATKDGQLLTDPITSDPISVIKGGMAYERWHYKDFFANTIAVQKKPLHFFTTKEVVRPDEVKYLYWLYPFDSSANQYYNIRFDYVDGTNFVANLEITLPVDKWDMLLAPLGFRQLYGMMTYGDLHPPNKQIKSYTVGITHTTSAGVAVVAPITFFMDYRNYYDSSFLLYHNSLGGIDTQAILGEVDASADYATTNAEKVVPPSGFEAALLVPQVLNVSNEETEKFNGNTNFISKDKLARLRDLLLSVKCYSVRIDDSIASFYPVIINKRNVKFYNSKDRLYGMAIEWQNAWSNKFYTPFGSIATDPNCPALLTFEVRQVTKNTLRIIWAMPMPYDRMEVTIDNGEPSEINTFVVEGNSGAQIVTFTNPAEYPDTAPITVKGRVICDEEINPPSLGPYSTVIIDVFANLLPIANDDLFTIAAGYTEEQELEGNALDNDYDPDGDAIEVIAADGATTAGGTFNIAADGKILYKAPSSIYNGVDSFDYTIREVDTPAMTDTATVRINVGDVGLGGAIYVKITERNHTQNPSGTHAEGDFYLEYWADPLGTIPKDLTGLGITINYRQTISHHANTVGGPLMFPPNVNDFTHLASGTEEFMGHVTTVQTAGILIFLTFELDLLPGTGYIAL